MMRAGDGFEPISWSKALEVVAKKFADGRKHAAASSA